MIDVIRIPGLVGLAGSDRGVTLLRPAPDEKEEARREGLCHCLERRHHSEASYRSWAQYEKDGNWERARVRYEQVLGQYHSFAREYSPELARTYLRSVLGYYAGYFREINDRPLFEGIHIDFLDPVQFIRSRLEDLERKEAGTGATRTQRPAPQGSSA